MRPSIAALAAALTLSFVPWSALEAQTAPATAPALVLVPYGEPLGTDPHAGGVTTDLTTDLANAGVAVTTIAPVDHMDAVSNAAKICADNHASALLIPDGRYEQTTKTVSISFITTVKYPTHVEFRLDEVGCDRAVKWSTVATGDQAPGGLYSVSNVGSAVDRAFADAVKQAVSEFADAKPPMPVYASPPVTSAPPAVTPAITYLLLPLAQPKVADPRAGDIAHSLLEQMQERKLDVKLGDPIDHLSAVAAAPQLCAANGAQAIVVLDDRIEQSGFTGHSHAALRLVLLDCSGAVLGRAVNDADIGQLTMRNFGASAVAVSEKAMGPALDQLFPSTKH